MLCLRTNSDAYQAAREQSDSVRRTAAASDVVKANVDCAEYTSMQQDDQDQNTLQLTV
jgi:hypothetical protein